MTLLPGDPSDGLGEQRDVNIRQAVTQGGVWIFLGRWSIRGIGILSTIFLARLLAPEDFGLVSISLVMIGLAETIGKEGQNLAVIRHPNLDRDFMDSAWTASIITGLVLGGCVFAAAPFMAAYFNEPRATLLVQVLSVRVFAMGLQNIGLALNRKQFNFSKDFNYTILEKVIPVVFTLSIAYFARNYWALVFGSIAGYAGAIIASYILHPYRPKICFKHIGAVWSFSLWVVLEKFAMFATMRIGHLFVPGVGNTTQLGHYHIGSELARMPVGELFMPLGRVLFPAYVRLIRQPAALANAYIYALSVSAVVCLPVSIGFAMVASDFTMVIYGAKWMPMAPVVELLALASGAVAIISTVTPILQALGKSRMSASLFFLQAMLLTGGLLLFQSRFDSTTDIAMVRLVTVLMTLPVALFCAHTVISLPPVALLKAFWRPVIAVGAMTLVLLYVWPQHMELRPELRLGWRVMAGGLVYTLALLLLWLASGKPAGAERAVMELLGINRKRPL